MAFAPLFPLLPAYGTRTLLFFFETDCPTCRLITPYLNHLASAVAGISQDPPPATQDYIQQLGVRFPVFLDEDWKVSRAYDPPTVPALYLIGPDGVIEDTLIGFDKAALNKLAGALGHAGTLALEFDGAPAFKPGCMARHREPVTDGENALPSHINASAASHILIDEAEDAFEYCRKAFGDPLPVIPPTREHVERMIAASGQPRDHGVALVPPCYGPATIEKIAANAVMAGCEPAMMRVLIPVIRAACDERFNLHGVQATTHFAAPLIILNGPVRHELGFACGGNVFSNVARSNSTLGRAFQLILTNVGGARPGGIDMSALGNPGKFSYCIAENEETSPWEPLHVERGISPAQNGVTLFAGDGLHGISEHTARAGRVLLKAICAALTTVWSWRVCMMPEALVVLCPEHVETLRRDKFSKDAVRHFLFENTGVPLRAYEEDDGGEGTQLRSSYEEVTIAGERCYRKFRAPESIHIAVAGGTAGKFSAVIGSWSTGPRGSQMVTYGFD
ncbi:MAG TPA: TlpA disulfide reductase family protein [Bryobacteraceae bacterium]|nr:TlpA disulfide reductase family protein [Bryobacteraceae bacterium]